MKLLRWFCKRDYLLDIEGDLLELYERRANNLGHKKAKWLLYKDVLLLFRPGMIRTFKSIPTFNPIIMLKHNFKIAFRQMSKQKTYSLISIGGLALGMTVALLIGLWIHDEVDYDTFHENQHEIYQVIANRDFGDHIFTDRNMTFPFAKAIAEEVPGVKHSVWTSHNQPALMVNGEISAKQIGFFVGGPFFEMFSWTFVQGNKAQALNDPNSIILTESTARIYFGDQDPMNQTLMVDNHTEVKITGIVNDPPDNSTLQFDYIRPFNYSSSNVKRFMDHWQSFSWKVFLQISPQVNRNELDQALTEIMVERTESEQSTYFTFPMKKWHLYNEFKNGINSGGNIRYVRLFGIIALIILVIACINFMNLSTARSQKRATEVAIRKTLGSSRGILIQQFLTESIAISFLAFVAAMIAVVYLLPSFNQLVEKSLHIDLLNPMWWGIGLAVVLFAGLLAGSYPALVLSSFKPIKALSGKYISSGKANLPRRFLVVFQFVASIALISATILVFQQIQFVKSRDMGYDANNLIMIPSTGTVNTKFVAIKGELMTSGLIEVMTRTSSPITRIWSKSHAPDWPGRPPETDILFSNLSTDVQFTETMNINIIEGKDFSGVPSDSSAVLINQAAMKAMNLEHPIGQQLDDNGIISTIIGVIDDVVMESPFETVAPLQVHYNSERSAYVHIRLKKGIELQAALETIQNTFEEFNPEYPFEYKFVDEAFGKKFASEVLVRKITNLFAGIAIFISCLGLMGLVSFILERRMKEIAIRKILGASWQQLLLLISKEFLVLVFIALLIATPLTYYGVYDWLQNYEYQVSVNLWVFLIVGSLLMLLTLIIVSIQTTRIAFENPIHAIRSER